MKHLISIALYTLIILGSILIGVGADIVYNYYHDREKHSEPDLNGPCVDTAYVSYHYRWVTCTPEQEMDFERSGNVIMCKCKTGMTNPL